MSEKPLVEQRIQVACHNCDYRGYADVLKGRGLDDSECPKCKMKKLYIPRKAERIPWSEMMA